MGCSPGGHFLKSRNIIEEKHNEIKEGVSGLTISWALSIFCGLGGLAFLSEGISISGVSLILLALVLLPPTHTLLKKKWDFTLSKKMKITIVIILIGLFFVDTLSDSTMSQGDVINPNQMANVTEKAETSTVEKKVIETSKKSTTVTSNKDVLTKPVEKPAYDIEMSTQQIFEEFEGLSDLQTEEKEKEFKGKRIKTSLYVDKVDQASLSTQYVAMEMYEWPYNLIPAVKAFFQKEEKDNLLQASIGDTLVFSGEFVNFHKGSMTNEIEFTKSKVIKVNK